MGDKKEQQTEEVITESGLAKSLSDLDDLLKAQIVRGPGSSKGAMKEQKLSDTQDHMPDGTDYDGKGSRVGKAQGNEDIEEEVEEDEDDEEARKGADFDDLDLSIWKAQDDEEMEEEDEEEEEEEPEGGTEKGLPSPGKEKLMKKTGKYTPPGKASLTKGEEDGIEVSEWLYHLTHALNKALIGMEMRLSEQISKAHNGRGDITKSMAQAMVDFDSQVRERLGKVDDIEKSAARAPKSVLKVSDKEVNKGPSPDASGLDRRQILGLLSKGMDEGKVDPFAVLKYETTGQIAPDVLKSIGVETELKTA